jgi:hypothetical protein
MPIKHILETHTLDEIEAKIEELGEVLKEIDPDDDEHDIVSGRQEDFYVALLNLEQPLKEKKMIKRETYEPGNMTRYEILYVEWDEFHPLENVRMFSITVFNGSSGTSFKLQKDMGVNCDYISKKTGWEGSDLAAIMGYMKRQGVTIGYTVPNHDEWGKWTPDAEQNLHLARKFEEFENE